MPSTLCGGCPEHHGLRQATDAYFNPTVQVWRNFWLKVTGLRSVPSGHDISEKFSTDNGAAIPPNLIAIPNTESNSFYLRYCEEKGIKPHPARYPAELPEYFIRMLTEPGDFVVDPFAGSCVTGEVCERTKRRWVCVEIVEDYCDTALGRFIRDPKATGPVHR